MTLKTGLTLKQENQAKVTNLNVKLLLWKAI